MMPVPFRHDPFSVQKPKSFVTKLWTVRGLDHKSQVSDKQVIPVLGQIDYQENLYFGL